jgi:hypothetical protein
MSAEGMNLGVNVDDDKTVVDGSHKYRDGRPSCPLRDCG